MSGIWTGGRRSFLQKLTAATSALPFLTTASAAPKEIPKRVLGRTGLNVTMLGFGAAWLGIYKDEKPAVDLGLRALELGINFFDTARDYGVSEERLGKALEGQRKNVVLMTKVLSRGREEADKDLETSLKMLRTDYLDVWQIHSVQTQAQLDRIFGHGGAMRPSWLGCSSSSTDRG